MYGLLSDIWARTSPKFKGSKSSVSLVSNLSGLGSVALRLGIQLGSKFYDIGKF